jgi:type I restriction enzyme S subunit
MTLGDISKYPSIRINVSHLDEKSYVGVDNLLSGKMGKTVSSCVPTKGSAIAYDVNDILIGNIRPYLQKIWLANESGGSSPDVIVVRITSKDCVLPSYLYQVLASDKFFAFNMRYSKGAKMPRGDKKSIANYPVPIPPLEEQERIVSILDKFEALTNDISIGLPAELEMRRKQYEYYRDKLLTFEEAC